MSDEPHNVPGSGTAPNASNPATAATPDVVTSEQKPVNQLTPEEQMALFEKELKETDWGHQPC
jgi:hypothetical protein